METAIIKSKAASATKMQRENTAEEPIKWSAQMLESFEQAKRGEWVIGDINNFWGNI